MKAVITIAAFVALLGACEQPKHVVESEGHADGKASSPTIVESEGHGKGVSKTK